MKSLNACSVLMACLLGPLSGIAGVTTDAPAVTLEIGAQPLRGALSEFGRQSGLQVVFVQSDVDARLIAGRLAGSFSPEEALARLLRNTALEYEFLNSKTVAIRSKTEKKRNDAVALMTGDTSAVLTLAQADTVAGDAEQAAGSSDAAAERDSSAEEGSQSMQLEEIVVTAQKRVSVLEDTPLSLTVLRGEELERRSLVSAVDYLSSVPGVHIESWGLGENQLTIRGLGLATGQSPTAGAYLGDVPLTNALDFAMIDVKLVDMARVEILRGPQGTLYGSGALGGAVRQIPMAPVMGSSEARVKLGYSSTSESSDTSYNAVGVLNVPLVEETLAFRVAAYHFKKAGYIDNVSSPEMESLAAATQVPVLLSKNAGGHEYTGVRATTLFKPSDPLSLTLMLGYQELTQDGRSELNMSAGDYVDSALDTGREFVDQKFTFANLVADYDFNWATLTSSTSLTRVDAANSFSHTRVIPTPSVVPTQTDRNAFFQELRLASQLEGPFQFVTGAYFENVDREEDVAITWVSPNLAELEAFWGTTDPNILSSRNTADLEQLAFFGEVNYELNEQFTLRAGARWFDYERHDSSITSLGLAPGVDPFLIATGDLPTSEDGQVYKLGVDYKPTDDVLLYASWSQGFRLGQTTDNTSTYSLFGDICDKNQDGLIDGTRFPFASKITLKSDALDNYEIGSKLRLLNGRLSLSTAAYRISWYDLPVSTTVAVDGLGCDATFNGGEARSQGVEFDAALRATEHLQVNLSGSLTDTEYLDDLTGKQGRRLPFSPRSNASVGLQYNFALSGRKSFLRSDFVYVGRSATDHNPPDRDFTDAYRTLSVRGGVAFDKVDVELYGTNLTNEDAVIGVFNLDRGWRLEPRTIGLEVNFAF